MARNEIKIDANCKRLYGEEVIMKCPVCKDSDFVPETIEKNLEMLACNECGGRWLQPSHYWRWKEEYNGFSKKANEEVDIVTYDSKADKVCPECSEPLKCYRVGRGTNIVIDRCEACNGVWFDKNEWEALRQKQFHDEIHLVFSSFWQRKYGQ